MSKRGWFEEYECGCVSDTVRTRSELLGYCGQHGGDRKGVFREVPGVAVQIERIVRGRPLSPDSKRQRQKEKDEGIVADRRRKCGLPDEPNESRRVAHE